MYDCEYVLSLEHIVDVYISHVTEVLVLYASIHFTSLLLA